MKTPKVLTVHPLSGQPVAALTGRVASVPLQECGLCSDHVKNYKNRCIAHKCGCTVLADLLTEHADGGRVYCVKCFTPVVNDYEMVQRRVYTGPSLTLWPEKDWKDVPIPKWVRRSPKEMMTGPRWRESGEAWKEWHTTGIEFVLMSGRVAPWLFSEPLTPDGTRILKAMNVRPDDLPWATRLAGYLLAGVGGEYLLKARYLQLGYSLRTPDNREKPLAKRDTPEARWYNPYRSVSFGTILLDHNLRLICSDPALYRPMGLAMWWRNQPGHTTSAGDADWGGAYVALGATLKRLHDALLKGSGDKHEAEMQKVIAETKPIHLGATTSA